MLITNLQNKRPSGPDRLLPATERRQMVLPPGGKQRNYYCRKYFMRHFSRKEPWEGFKRSRIIKKHRENITFLKQGRGKRTNNFVTLLEESLLHTWNGFQSWKDLKNIHIHKKSSSQHPAGSVEEKQNVCSGTNLTKKKTSLSIQGV